jgi:hypothetical protein
VEKLWNSQFPANLANVSATNVEIFLFDKNVPRGTLSPNLHMFHVEQRGLMTVRQFIWSESNATVGEESPSLFGLSFPKGICVCNLQTNRSQPSNVPRGTFSSIQQPRKTVLLAKRSWKTALILSGPQCSTWNIAKAAGA